MREDKRMSIAEAVGRIEDGMTVGLGGNVLHRAPMAIVKEMARQQKKNLKIVKTAGAMDIDLLCYADCVKTVTAGFVSYESEFSLANHYRKGVESGRIVAEEHACYTIISALRAAAYGIPFMPVRGLQVSDLTEVNEYFAKVANPFGNEWLYAVRAIQPDIAVIHVHEADRYGNARMDGPKFEDVLLSRAAKTVIISAETIVPDTRFAYAKEKADIPHFMVSAVVHAPKGAAPGDCPGKYDIDRREIEAFKKLAGQKELDRYLKIE
ncbi:MAG: CoA-transferase [Eubacteriales bacterium]|nr:CoA-transferase [Eubacteriales bacterium]